MTYLELDNICKQFGETVAVCGVDLSVDQGTMVTFLGPSGCGKTTTLRIVAGFEQADAGSVVVDGRDLTGTPANRRDMGMVFQAYSLFPNMTAEQNVAFGLRVRRWQRSRRMSRAAELLDLVGLADARGLYPHQLSGGMQQRVALARALAIEPRILLLDEPLSALDAKVRVQLREEIRRIQAEFGTTTLYVTHDQEEALSISDRVAVFCAGRVDQVATPADIYSSPRTPFVADFVGTASKLDVTVKDGAAGSVEHEGVHLDVAPLPGRQPGDRVTIFLRPESIRVEAESASEHERGIGLTGNVLAHSFLGANTRLKLSVGDAQLMADVASAAAAALPVGSRVRVTFSAETARPMAGDASANGRVTEAVS